MKIKHLVSTLLLAAGLAFSAPSIAPEIGISNMMTTVSAAQEGWNQDSNGWYYLQNNVRLTGLQTIGGATYYLRADGYRVSGPVRLGETMYFLPSGNRKALYRGHRPDAVPEQQQYILLF